MHGRPRYPRPDSSNAQKTQAAEQRVLLYSRLTTAVLERLQSGQYDKQSLELAARLLEQNPEVYTVWNHRKRAMLDMLSQGGEIAVEAIQVELALTQRALQKHPKSYATWHHRKWLVAKHVTSLHEEVLLVNRLLEADERNFHGWGYRQFLMELMHAPPDAEEEYAASKINLNFSNYSAWHLKTKLLKKAHQQRRTVTMHDLLHDDVTEPNALVPLWALKEELRLVTQAVYTDPGDQSPWLYHGWLLGSMLSHTDQGSNAQDIAEVLQQEIAMCKDILLLEASEGPTVMADSSIKWPMLRVAQLQQLSERIIQPTGSNAQQEAVEHIYKELQTIDGLRKGFYLDAERACVKVSIRSAA